MLKNQRGNALLLVIIVFATLFALLGMSLDRGTTLFGQIYQKHLENAALNLAEAGIEYTLYKMMTSGKEFFGEENIILETGTFSTSVSEFTPSGMIEIYSKGIAKGKGQIETVHKTLRVVVYFDSEYSENPPVVHAWEEVL